MKKKRIMVILPPLRDSADRIMCSTDGTIPLASFKLNKRTLRCKLISPVYGKFIESSYYIITKACG